MLLPDSKPFQWDTETYREHIESACRALGSYISNNLMIWESTPNTWTISRLHSDNHNKIYPLYTADNLHEIIWHFIKLVPINGDLTDAT